MSQSITPPARTLPPEGPFRIVGAKKAPVLSLHASGEALARGLRHIETAMQLFGPQAVAFKGVRYFKTHEEANEDRADGLARCMAMMEKQSEPQKE